MAVHPDLIAIGWLGDFLVKVGRQTLPSLWVLICVLSPYPFLDECLGLLTGNS
jgi:hypothetical protein